VRAFPKKKSKNQSKSKATQKSTATTKSKSIINKRYESRLLSSSLAEMKTKPLAKQSIHSLQKFIFNYR
jgi:hypothetical protein